MPRYFITGGAGFIGSHLTVSLLLSPENEVIVYDNFSSGREWHLDAVKGNPRLKIIRGDIKNEEKLKRSLAGADIVYHLASNPDIAKAVTQPTIDFWEGTFLTNQVVEAMRVCGVRKLLYASGSGVYGDVGELETREDHGPLVPISTYGASKLAGESLICAYCHMFDLDAAAFRFANVIGPHPTHGVIFDFVRKLMAEPSRLEILGDGLQSKSYIFISDIVSAMRLIETKFLKNFAVYNVATQDYITVREIAEMTVKAMNIGEVEFRYSGGNRGWKGDVPIVRFNTEKIRSLGWKNRYSTREAVQMTIESVLKDARAKLFE